MAGTVRGEGAREDIGGLAADTGMGQVNQRGERGDRRVRARVAMAALFGIVALAGFGVAPIFLLSVIAVAVVLVTRCIDADEAFAAVDGRLLALIFSMLAIGVALQTSGSVTLIVAAIAPWLQGLPPFFFVWAMYLLTLVLPVMMSNTAGHVVGTPNETGVDEGRGR